MKVLEVNEIIPDAGDSKCIPKEQGIVHVITCRQLIRKLELFDELCRGSGALSRVISKTIGEAFEPS